MKLLKCHVDNFGGLSDFNFVFSEGLTVIHEPNGFGKSTLAAFIKAMFYGLPRTGGRDISNNERKKYLPWQGGSYGGNLDFSIGNIEYRIYREFGKTAAGDKFELYDLTSRCYTTRFSPNLGETIFQLDAESYTRSTYMPQQDFGEGGFSTDSIRAKLTNLVNATDDLNNCETALEALYSCRLQYETYRGAKGKISELKSSILSLEAQINKCQEDTKELPELNKTIGDLTKEKLNCEEEIKTLQEQYRIGSAAVLLRKKQNCEENIKSYQRILNDIERKFPNGLPSKEEVQEQRDALKAVSALEATQRLRDISEDELKCYKACERIFADADTVNSDIENCQSRSETYSRLQTRLLASQLTGEEKCELETLEQRFEAGLPEEKEIKHCMDSIEELSTKKGELRQAVLTSDEISRLEALRKYFATGKVDVDKIKSLDEMRSQRDRLKASAESFVLPDDDSEKLRRLYSVFGQYVPEEEEIDAQQRNCRRISELETKKSTFTTIHKYETAPKAESKLPLEMVGLGAALLVIAAFCLFAGQLLPGRVIAALGGIVILVGAIALIKTRKTVTPPVEKTITQSAITAEEEQELNELKHSQQVFLATFYSETEPADKMLNCLFTDRSDFLRISKRNNELKSNREKALAEAAKLQRELEEFFKRYCPARAYCDSMIEDMRENATEYKNLNEIAKRKGVDSRKLQEEINELDGKIRAFLHITKDEDASITLQELREARSDYIRLNEKDANARSECLSLQRECANEAHAMDAILEKYAQLPIEPSDGYTEYIKNLRRLYNRYKDIAVKIKENERSRATVSRERENQEYSLLEFLRKYQLQNDNIESLLNYLDNIILERDKANENLSEKVGELVTWRKELDSMEIPTDFDERNDSLNLNDIRNEENTESEKLEEITKRLEHEQRKHNRLREIAESIPQLQDELETKRAELITREHDRDLLDAAQKYMNAARDSLSNAYVGRVENRFLYYMNTLLGDKSGRISLDKDLKLRIEKEGEARNIASFSVGMRDCVLICMRLALVDVMFETEQPCVILDDPFVNLDEQRTQYALELLKEVAQTRQVIYLVCNKSRVAS